MPDRAPLHRPLIGFDAGASHTIDRAPRLYDQRRWRRVRAAYLARHPLCACGCGYPATVVDHRLPHCGDLAAMYDWNNLQAMTKACHDRKTASVDGGFGNPLRR
jgi:5-methylcytosine-specific restriction protein A